MGMFGVKLKYSVREKEMVSFSHPLPPFVLTLP